MPVFGVQVITETGALFGETEYEGQFSVNSLIEALAKENSAWTGKLVLPSNKKRGLGGDELLQGDCNFILLQTVQAGNPSSSPSLHSINASTDMLDCLYSWLDPASLNSCGRSSHSRSGMLQYYGQDETAPTCSLLEVQLPSGSVNASHIVQKQWFLGKGTDHHLKLLDLLGLKRHDDPRNLMPLHKGVEKLFDGGLIALQPVSNGNWTDTYQVVNLAPGHPELNQYVEDIADVVNDGMERFVKLPSGEVQALSQLKGTELVGKHITFGGAHVPSHRCIAFHFVAMSKLAMWKSGSLYNWWRWTRQHSSAQNVRKKRETG